MKLKDAEKRFSFLKNLDLDEDARKKALNSLSSCVDGSEEIHITPLVSNGDPADVIYQWDLVFSANKHKMNSTLLDLEKSNRKKIGARSIAEPWHVRKPSVTAYYSSQDKNHVPAFKPIFGDGELCPISIEEASNRMKATTSSGYPFLSPKEKVKQKLLQNFDKYYERSDPAALFYRTAENRKTRTVWGFPFADTFFETLFYVPLLEVMKTFSYRVALVSPEEVAKEVTRLILLAQSSDRLLFSIDFAGFDASIKFQYIVCAFEEIKSYFLPSCHSALDIICKRIYTMRLVTPDGVMSGVHGVPSGSTFTNELDSIVQRGIAMVNDFIKICEMVIQGDDGVYVILKENIEKFTETFVKAGLRVNLEKSYIAPDYAVFCQNLYHLDYLKDGFIGPIYPVYRALNRLMFLERFVSFKKMGMTGKEFFGIRALTILENCKYHPLFEDLVRFIVEREKYALEVSEQGLMSFCAHKGITLETVSNLNHQFGSDVTGIYGFESYKLVQKILAELELLDDDRV